MKTLTILFNTYPVAFDCPGGGEVQLAKYIDVLNELGVRTLRYDPWNPRPQFDAADIVHYFSVQGGSGRFCAHVSHVRKLPLVISPIIWIDAPSNYGMEEISGILRLADHVLPNSRAECDQLSELFQLPRDFFTPVVNGVDALFFEAVSPALFREHLKLEGPFLLCMGNIESRKNQLRLIEALKGTGLHLVLAGQEREAAYAAQCRQLADDTVHFVGQLAHGSEMQRSAYAAAEGVVLPSTLETPGLAALEAAAAGCRLAITREGCTKEYFGDFAVYLDPLSTTSIREAVLSSLERPLDGELVNHVREHYTWRHAGQQLVNVYERLLGRSR